MAQVEKNKEILIAALNELADPSSKGVSIVLNGTELNLFIVKKESQITVFENACPHTQGPLDWTPDQFLDTDNNYIMCANHGALFQIDNGYCVYGPCKAESLRALPFTIKNNNIYLIQ